MSLNDPEGLGHQRPPMISPTQIDMLRSLDAEGLRQYAQAGMDLDTPDPIRTFTGIAFEAEPAIPTNEAVPLLEDVGAQIDEETIPPALASLLRHATDEGVYPQRLTSVQGWTAMAKLFESRSERVGRTTARVLLTGMGIDRQVLADALPVSRPDSINPRHIVKSIHDHPEAQQALADLVAGMMRPLVLPELPLGPNRFQNLAWAMKQVLVGPSGTKLRRRAAVEKQSAMIDTMSLRYLDRPQLKDVTDPQDSIATLRRFCSGEAIDIVANSESAGTVPTAVTHRMRRLLRAFRDSLTPEDRKRIREFIDGATQELVLDRAEPMRAEHRDKSAPEDPEN